MAAARPVYPHTLPGRPPQDWEPLDQQLAEVGRLAGEFTAALRALNGRESRFGPLCDRPGGHCR